MYERYKGRYNNGWAKEEHIARLTNLGYLTEQEYEDITGEKYES